MYWFFLYILCEVQHIIFAKGTREGTTIGHMVVCMVLSDITCQRVVHVGNGDKKRFTKLISISMGIPFIARDRSGLLQSLQWLFGMKYHMAYL
jgi:hypothetical protein